MASTCPFVGRAADRMVAASSAIGLGSRETGDEGFSMRGLFAAAFGSLASAIAVTAPIDELPLRKPELWTPPAISTAGYESTPSFTPDGALMLYLMADPGFRTFRLAASRCTGGRWSAPERPGFGARPPIAEADPGFSVDGGRLFFVSTRQGGGAEDFDIWSVTRDAQGRWGRPERLPAPVNSTASELLPRADAAGNLYFGSSRPGGHGGGDIYMARETAPGRWSVENVGPPVSTPAFEYEAEISSDGRTMVVVADRGDRSHLYLYKRVGSAWVERGRIPARRDEFQVGPLLSPKADRLLFAQRAGERSGELFLIDLSPQPDLTWPPACRRPGEPAPGRRR